MITGVDAAGDQAKCTCVAPPPPPLPPPTLAEARASLTLSGMVDTSVLHLRTDLFSTRTLFVLCHSGTVIRVTRYTISIYHIDIHDDHIDTDISHIDIPWPS